MRRLARHDKADLASENEITLERSVLTFPFSGADAVTDERLLQVKIWLARTLLVYFRDPRKVRSVHRHEYRSLAGLLVI